jgi:hypothetical protein
LAALTLQSSSAHSAESVRSTIHGAATAALLRLPRDDPALGAATLFLHGRAALAAELIPFFVDLSAGPAFHTRE